MSDNVEVARREAINKIRAKAAEAKEAFTAVLELRAKIVEARRSLEFAKSDPRNPPDRALGLEKCIGELTDKLMGAERFCRLVNEVQLTDHDQEVERLAEVARQNRERQEADRARAEEECQRVSAHRRLEQLRQRAAMEAQEADLLAGLQVAGS